MPFTHKGQVYMLHIGFDGTGYQTALARALNDDLTEWEDVAVVLPRGEKGTWDHAGRAGCSIVSAEDCINAGPYARMANTGCPITPRMLHPAGRIRRGQAFSDDILSPLLLLCTPAQHAGRKDVFFRDPHNHSSAKRPYEESCPVTVLFSENIRSRTAKRRRKSRCRFAAV